MAYFSKRDWKTIILVLWLISTPFLINGILSIQEGIVRDKEYDWNSSDIIANPTPITVISANSSYSSYTVNTYTVDNQTHTITIPSLDFDTTVQSITRVMIYIRMNASILTTDLYKIRVSINYIGSGNITVIKLDIDNDIYLPVDQTIRTINNPTETNYTVDLNLETFESFKIATSKTIFFEIIFDDVNYLPQLNDYFEISIHFYKKDTIVSKDSLIAGIIGFLAIVNFAIAIAITKFWNPLSSRRRR